MKNYAAQSTYRAGLIQSQAYRVLANFMAVQLTPYDLSLPEWTLLGYLFEYGPTTPRQLADYLSIKPSGVTKLRNNLMQKGLIVAYADTHDLRSHAIGLTGAGHDKVAAIEKDLRVAMRAWLTPIEPREFLIYLKVMEEISQLVV